MGTNNLTTRTNNYFCEQKLKSTEQIIMHNEQNIKHREYFLYRINNEK